MDDEKYAVHLGPCFMAKCKGCGEVHPDAIGDTSLAVWTDPSIKPKRKDGPVCAGCGVRYANSRGGVIVVCGDMAEAQSLMDVGLGRHIFTSKPGSPSICPRCRQAMPSVSAQNANDPHTPFG